MAYLKLKDGKIINLKTVTSGNPIVAQADSIEELCEAYCVTNCVFPNLKDAMAFAKKDKEQKFMDKIPTIYGAVWNETGLKYIAKTDSNGKLQPLF